MSDQPEPWVCKNCGKRHHYDKAEASYMLDNVLRGMEEQRQRVEAAVQAERRAIRDALRELPLDPPGGDTQNLNDINDWFEPGQRFEITEEKTE